MKAQKRNKKLLSSILAVTVAVGMIPTMVAAEETKETANQPAMITEIYGSANGWNNNAAWVGFSLSDDLDLTDPDADIQIRYEYLENNEIKSVLSNGAVYEKNKSWGGYLVDEDGQRYSSGTNSDSPSDNTTVPKESFIQSNLSVSASKSLDVAEKITNGTVTQVRTVVEVTDEEGVSSVAKSNWVTYTLDGTQSTPMGITVDSVRKYVNAHPETRFDAVATVGDRQFTTLEDAIKAVSSENATVTLLQNIALDKMLDITTDGVTLDLNGKTITSADDFHYTYDNDRHLVNVTADNVTIKNGILQTTQDNKHGLNIFGSQNVIVKNLTIDHSNAYKGAPMVVNASSVTVDGKLDLKLGLKSWYGINVDAKGASSTLAFADGSHVSMEDATGLRPIVYLDGTDTENITISNPENAGLEFDGNNILKLHKHNAAKVEANDATCTEDGNIEYWYCADCGKYFSDEACETEITLEDTIIKATGHGETEVVNVKDATCTEEGYTGDTVCKDCGAVLEQGKTIPKLAHSYKDGKCTVCGAADPDYKPVDSENNGTDSPLTGDSSNLGLWIVLLLVSASGLTGATLFVRKRNTR